MHTENLLVNALYFLIAAVIAVPLFKRFGLGSILGYLFAGLILGPQATGLVDDPEAVLHFAEYGVILLLFIIGLELAPEKLWNMRGQIAMLGGSQLCLSALMLGAVMLYYGMSFPVALVLSLTLALSSTAFAIQLMSEEHVLASPLGRKGFSILLLQDLAVIPILLLVGVLAQTGGDHEEGLAWYYGVSSVLLLLVFSRYGMNQLLGVVAATNNREIMTAASLLIVIGTAVLMELVGLSMGLGAFMAGIMLANSDFRHQLESDIEPFKGILLGLFFIAVGMTLNLNLLLEEPLLIIAAAVILRWRHVAFKEGILLGLMLSQGGEFAFVVLGQATQVQLVSAGLSEQITLIVGLSMAMTSPLVMLHRKLWRNRSKEQPDQDAYWDTHEPEVLIAGFGRFGQVIGRLLTARHIPFTAMDKNPRHVEFVKQFGNRLFYGDLTRLDLLKSAGIKHAKILVVAVDSIEESLAIVDLAREQNPRIQLVVRALDRFHAYQLHQRDVHSVIRETFASSLEAATDTLEILGFTEGQAPEMVEMFRKHDESLLQRSVSHMDNMDELLEIARQGRLELQQLFDQDKRNPMAT
jgi:monovalent cation:proton antiporter-2 (CPA2) family protein